MKIKAKSLVPMSFVLASLSACSDQESRTIEQSNIKDVANPGAPGDANTLFWVEGESISVGSCAKDVPTTRANCNLQVRKALVSDVTQRATQNVKDEDTRVTAAISAEIKSLKDSDPTVIAINKDIQNLTTQKSALDSAIASAKQQIETWTAKRANLDAQGKYDDEQLAAIAKLLQATPNDANLLNQQAGYKAERARITAEAAVLTDHINQVSSRMTYDQTTLSSVTSELTKAQDQLKKVYAELQVNSAKLETLGTTQKLLKAAGEGIPTVIGMIKTSTVTYRGNLLTPELQQSLRYVGTAIVPLATLKAGRYEDPNPNRYCPQKAEPSMSGSTLTSVKLTYLSPCGGTSHVYACAGLTCKASNGWVFTITNQTEYAYSGGSGVANMKFVSLSMDEERTDGGPLNALIAQ